MGAVLLSAVGFAQSATAAIYEVLCKETLLFHVMTDNEIDGSEFGKGCVATPVGMNAPDIITEEGSLDLESVTYFADKVQDREKSLKNRETSVEKLDMFLERFPEMSDENTSRFEEINEIPYKWIVFCSNGTMTSADSASGVISACSSMGYDVVFAFEE